MASGKGGVTLVDYLKVRRDIRIRLSHALALGISTRRSTDGSETSVDSPSPRTVSSVHRTFGTVLHSPVFIRSFSCMLLFLNFSTGRQWLSHVMSV